MRLVFGAGLLIGRDRERRIRGRSASLTVGATEGDNAGPRVLRAISCVRLGLYDDELVSEEGAAYGCTAY